MKDLKGTMTRIQTLIRDAFTKTGSLVALADGGQMEPERLQRTLELLSDQFERSTLELRRLCEEASPGVGGYAQRPRLRAAQITGTVDVLEYSWLHLRLNTLLPHCRYQTPAWLTDTIHRLLDDYAASGRELPAYRSRAVLVIEEYSDVDNRRIYDQDNKGYKAVSNALKGRVFPDDDQYDLGLVLLSTRSAESVTHITVIDAADLGEFFSLHTGCGGWYDVYQGR